MRNENGWHRVAATTDIPDEDVIRVEIGALGIAVYHVEGQYYATDDCCTHQEARLSDGFVIDKVIECPLHQGRFHIPTGTAKGAPVTRNLRVYPVKVASGQVYVRLAEDGEAR